MKTILITLTVILPLAAPAVEARTIQNADLGWRFHLGEVADAKSAACDDASWRTLDVPHDWSIEGDYVKTNPTGNKCGYLPSGIGWYRHVIEMPASWRGKVVTVEFEGVYMNSTVTGSHPVDGSL